MNESTDLPELSFLLRTNKFSRITNKLIQKINIKVTLKNLCKIQWKLSNNPFLNGRIVSITRPPPNAHKKSVKGWTRNSWKI